MGNQHRGDPKRTQTDSPRAVEDEIESVGGDYVSRILQYEWADVLVSKPPKTGGINWIPGHVGEQWGRVAPDTWNTIRVQGYDPHFRHYPTHERFERGEFQFELWFEPIGTKDEPERQVDESVIETLEESISEYVSASPNTGSWDTADVVSDTPNVLWRATYRFQSCDSVGYSDTLRQAIEDHEWVVALLQAVVDDADTE